MTGRADLDADPGTVAVGRTERQQAIAAIISLALIQNGIDFGSGDSDVIAVHSETIGFHIIDVLAEHGLTITRKRS